MVLVQTTPFFQLFFLGNIDQENVFYDILERKNAFLGYKNKKFKKSKNSHFSKGGNQCDWSKNGRFSDFSCQAIQARKTSFLIFQNEKTIFLGYKETRSSKSRNAVILLTELIDGFGPKMVIFPTFFFHPIQTRKMSFTILQNEKMPFEVIKTRRC